MNAKPKTCLQQLYDEFADNPRLDLVEWSSANGGRIPMLVLKGKNDDMPYALMHALNSDERFEDVAVFQVMVSDDNKPVMILTA